MKSRKIYRRDLRGKIRGNRIRQRRKDALDRIADIGCLLFILIPCAYFFYELWRVFIK